MLNQSKMMRGWGVQNLKGSGSERYIFIDVIINMIKIIKRLLIWVFLYIIIYFNLISLPHLPVILLIPLP